MITELVARARRRLLYNGLVAQSTYALGAAFAGFILLLLLGTQILDWHWLVLLPLASLAAGVWLTLHRLPDLYKVAQLVDHRLALADRISTAMYFSQATPSGDAEDIRAAQRADAEQVLRTVDLKRAFPFTVPRASYAVLLLAVVASSLFALRYGLNRRLDLRPPLASILQQALGFDTQQLAALHKKKPENLTRRPDLKDAMGLSLPEAEGKNPGELDAAPDSALETVGVPDVDNPKNNSSQADGAKGKTPGAEPIEGEQAEGEATDNAQASAAGQDAQGQGAGQGKQQGQQAAGKQGQGASGDTSSLMSKLRDAMQNLLSRMKQPPSGQGSQQSAMSQTGREGKQQSGAGQRGKSGSGQRQSAGQESDSQDGQPGEDAQNAQNAQGRGAGQSTDQQASKQPGSGIGRQDGNKDVKLAEQLAAMGKISEIIGKRSANVSGEVTVEVQSGNQQLRTAYTQTNALHIDAGGEISRDEVPVVFQSYVQQYFEQVRKQGTGNRVPASEKKP